jgi:predicted TIM-barrel fold metal-dependent hydrolase
MTLEIVDPHIHLWDLWTRLYPQFEVPSIGFIGSNAPIARSYLLNEFLGEQSEAVSIVGAVHVEAFPADPIAEVRVLQRVADRAPIPLGIVANADLSARGAAALLDRQLTSPMVRGIRQVLNRHAVPLYNYVDRDFLDDPKWHEGFALLGPRGVSFDLQLYPHQFAAAAKLADAHPQTAIILNHAGMWADRDLAGWRAWRDGLRVLAERPNISVKISGLGMFDHNWTTESLRPLVLETIDAFGTGRAMFASNFPVDKLFSTYEALWLAFSAITSGFSVAERADLFAGNASRVYRLDGPGAAR